MTLEEYAKIQGEIKEILEKTGFGDIIVKIQNFKLVFLFGISKRKIGGLTNNKIIMKKGIVITKKNVREMINRALNKLKENNSFPDIGICESCKQFPASFIFRGNKKLCGGCLGEVI